MNRNDVTDTQMNTNVFSLYFLKTNTYEYNIDNKTISENSCIRGNKHILLFRN